MSEGNESEREGLHLQTLTDFTKFIDEKIRIEAQYTESLLYSACIYRVPKELRKLNESAYTPRLFAIGPLHRDDNHLQTPMQYFKGSYTNCLLSRLTEGVTDPQLAEQKRSIVLEECVAEMKMSIDDAKKYYAEEVRLDEEILLVDGCFIIELLYRNHLREEEKRPIHGGDSGNTQASSKSEQSPGRQESTESTSKQKILDPIFYNNLTDKDVKVDLLLLENQIPFFVLQKLFDLTIHKIPNRPQQMTLNSLARTYFSSKNLINSKNNPTANGGAITTNCGSASDCSISMEEVPSRSVKYKHILHKVHEEHKNYLPQTNKKMTGLGEYPRMPSASNLEYAGVKFEPSTENDHFMVKFTPSEGPFWWSHRARFKIPTLDINDDTETLFRNLIAFEQCCPGISQPLTSYAILMDMLVNTDKDVDRLEKAQVMHNYLGSSKDATNLFNKLCKEIIRPNIFFFFDPCNDATKYSKDLWPKSMAYLRRTYFASPWTFIAFCVGFIVSGMSIIGSIFTVLEKCQ